MPRPITVRVWAEEGARILEQGEMVPGHLASANLIAARATGADPKVLAAVIRGAVAPPWPAEELRRINAPVLILNGTADAANQKVGGLLNEIVQTPFVSQLGRIVSRPERHVVRAGNVPTFFFAFHFSANSFGVR